MCAYNLFVVMSMSRSEGGRGASTSYMYSTCVDSKM